MYTPFYYPPPPGMMAPYHYPPQIPCKIEADFVKEEEEKAASSH